MRLKLMIHLINFEILLKFIEIHISSLNEEYVICIFAKQFYWLNTNECSPPKMIQHNTRTHIIQTIDWTNSRFVSFFILFVCSSRHSFNLFFFFCFSFFYSLCIMGNRYILWHHLAHLDLFNCSFERLYDSSYFLSQLLFQGFSSISDGKWRWWWWQRMAEIALRWKSAT